MLSIPKASMHIGSKTFVAKLNFMETPLTCFYWSIINIVISAKFCMPFPSNQNPTMTFISPDKLKWIFSPLKHNTATQQLSDSITSQISCIIEQHSLDTKQLSILIWEGPSWSLQRKREILDATMKKRYFLKLARFLLDGK